MEKAKNLLRRAAEAFHKERRGPGKREEAATGWYLAYWTFVALCHLGYLAIATIETFYGPSDTQMVPWSHVTVSSSLSGLALLGMFWTIRASPYIHREAPSFDELGEHVDKLKVLHAYYARLVYFLVVFLMGALGAIGTGFYYEAYGNTKPGDVSGALSAMYALNRWQTTFSMIEVIGFIGIGGLVGALALHQAAPPDQMKDPV